VAADAPQVGVDPVRRDRRATVAALGFLAVLSGVAGYRVWWLGETFFFRDLYRFFVPQRNHLLSRLAEGEWPPLWQPALHGGTPFAADISNYAFYPTPLLWVGLSAPMGLSADVLLHLLLAAVSAYWLARACGLRFLPSLLAATVYAYCGFTLSQHNLMNPLLSSPYLPLVVGCWHCWSTRGGRRWLALGGLLGALQVLTGGPVASAATALTTLAWGLAVSTARLPRVVGRWILLWSIVAGLAAFQLAPTFELIAHSVRGEGYGYDVFATWSVPPARLPELVLPGFLGRVDGLSDDSYWGARVVDTGFPYVVSLYFGAVTLALAVAGCASRRRHLEPRRLVPLWVGLATAGLVLSLGRHLPGFELLYRMVPVADIWRFPVKLVTIAVLPLALLAGAGAQRLAYEPISTKTRAATLAVASTLLACWATVAHWPRVTDQALRHLFLESGEEIRAGVAASFAHAAIFALALAAVVALSRGLPRHAMAVALVLLVAADLVTASRDVLVTTPRELLTSTPPLAERIKSEPFDGRIYRAPDQDLLRLEPPSDDVRWLVRWRIETLAEYVGAGFSLPVVFHEDYNGMVGRRMARLTGQVRQQPWERKVPLLAAANVELILTDEDVAHTELERLATLQGAGDRDLHLYRHRATAQRLTLVDTWVAAPDVESAFAAMLRPGFDPRVHAVLEGPAAGRDGTGCGRAMTWHREAHGARWTRYRVLAPCDGYLVLSETFYPGWQIVVDGEEVAPIPANGAFTGIPLGRGEHEVVHRFRPTSVAIGLGISLVTACGLTLGLAWRPGSPSAPPRPGS
jgi:hypothetical protein